MNFIDLKDIQQAIGSQGGCHLGTLLWWSLNGNHVERSRLEELAKQHGLEDVYLPNPIKPTTAFRRAWRHTASHCGDGLMLRQITEDEYSIVIGVVQEQADTVNLALDYTNLARVTFNKVHEIISTEGQHSALLTVRDLYQYHQAHTTQDIRTMLTGFVRLAGVSLREQGGTYFVPASIQKTLDALTGVVTEVGNNAVFQLPIYDAPQVRSTLTDVARSSLDSEIRALQADLEGFDDKTRQSTLERRLARFDELRSRVELFSGVLSFKAEDLTAKLTRTHRELRVKLGLEAPFVEPVQEEPEDETPQQVDVWAADQAVGF